MSSLSCVLSRRRKCTK